MLNTRITEITRDKDRNENIRENEEDVLGRKKRMTFMDTLVLQHLSDSTSITKKEIREEVDTFMFEGHDTTGWGLTWATYLIGLNPDAQARVHEELDEIFDCEREITFEDLRRMKYLECCIKEAQRIYPSVPLLGRTITDDSAVLGGFKVPKGVAVIILPSLVHRDTKHWPQPERFKPERFQDEGARHPYAFIPFSAGPRNCIGQKFAVLEEKAILASLFRKFKVTSLDHRDRVKPSPALILKSKVPIRVRMELRSACR